VLRIFTLTRAANLNGPLIVQNNCFFNADHAQGNGGAIFAQTDSMQNNVQLSNSTFGDTGSDDGGGAVFAISDAQNDPTQLIVTNCRFVENNLSGGSSGDGGAIYTDDNLSVTGGSFAPDTSQHNGGAIAYEPIRNLASNPTRSNITFTSNTAVQGGAVYVAVSTNQGAVKENISGNLFNGNQATVLEQGVLDDGGGLYVSQITSGAGSATLNLFNSTFYQNNSDAFGGAIGLLVDATDNSVNSMNVISLTVYKNQAASNGGGLYVDPTSVFAAAGSAPVLTNNIIAGNMLENPPTDGFDIYGSIFTSSYNLVGIGTGATVTNNGGAWLGNDQIGTMMNPKDPVLDPMGLQNNGGPTLTIKLAPNSPCLQAGNNRLLALKDGTQLDQRGFARPADVSIGAYDPGA
jgi:predicted outer membrane repeat protein